MLRGVWRRCVEGLSTQHAHICTSKPWTHPFSSLPRSQTQVRLDLGCVRLARDPSSTLMEPLAALTALSDLRMRVYSNGETPLTLHVSQLKALTNLEVRRV